MKEVVALGHSLCINVESCLKVDTRALSRLSYLLSALRLLPGCSYNGTIAKKYYVKSWKLLLLQNDK